MSVVSATTSKVIRVQIQNLHIHWFLIYPIWFHCFWIILDKSITYQKFFFPKKLFHFDSFNLPISMRLFQLNFCEWKIAFLHECLQWKGTRCVNFELDLHVLLRLYMRPYLVDPNETFRKCGPDIKLNLIFSKIYGQMTHSFT